jgi:hypothetical protein
VRRKFYDAQDSDGRRAAEMLALIGQLYAVEREAKELDDAARRRLRQERAVPVLAQIEAWLGAEGELVLPKSPLGQAITYTRNQWAALCEYTTQGFLAIDNNAAERALKRVAIGRNYAGFEIMRSVGKPTTRFVGKVRERRAVPPGANCA